MKRILACLTLAAVIAVGFVQSLQASGLSMPPYRDSLASCFMAKDVPKTYYNQSGRARWNSKTHRNFDTTLAAAKTCAKSVCNEKLCDEIFCEMAGNAKGGADFASCLREFPPRSK